MIANPSKTLTIILRVIGGAVILFGFAILAIELYHFLDRQRQLDLGNIAWGSGLVVGGALILQFGNVALALKALADALQNLPVFNAFRRRASDTGEAPIPPRADGSDKVEKIELPPPGIAGGA